MEALERRLSDVERKLAQVLDFQWMQLHGYPRPSGVEWKPDQVRDAQEKKRPVP